MTSIGDVITLIQATANAVEYSRNVRHAEKEAKELRGQIQSLGDTLEGFIAVAADLTDEKQRVFEDINSHIESYMTDLKEKLDQGEGFRRYVKRVLWPLKKDGVNEAIQAIHRLDIQLRNVFGTQNIESQYTVS